MQTNGSPPPTVPHLSLWLSLILCLPQNWSSSPSFCPTQASLRRIFLLSHPFSISYVSRLPHLISLPPKLPLLSPMSTAAENPAQTPACVFVHAAIRWISGQTSHVSEQIKKWKKHNNPCLSNALIKTLIAEGYITDMQTCTFKSLE